MTATSAYFRLAVLTGVVCATLLGGCVKRKETITVRRDGSVEIRLEYDGDREDMENGAPGLAPAPGWEFQERDNRDGDGKESIIRTATTTIPPGRPIPAVYPMDDPEAEDLVVRHPTTLTVERRWDGTYYYFRRVYEARPWAYVDYWRRTLIEEPLDRGGDKPIDELSAVKKQELALNLIHFAGQKHLAIVRKAVASLSRPLPQDTWLSVHAQVMGVVDSVDWRHVLELLEQRYTENGDEDDVDDDALEELAARLNDQIADAVRSVFVRSGVSRRDLAAITDAINFESRRFEITEDYQDETWEIHVGMPGQIVGHNGDGMVDDLVKWEVNGRSFFDRDVELMVTSRVTHAPGR